MKLWKGFTLAEVLITLGIIGIVAAMTIPTLVHNYQKKVTINRLKHTYATLMQVFKMAEVEHGPMSLWNMGQFAGTETTPADARNYFVKTYMLPYLNGAENPSGTLKTFGYNSDIKYPDGTVLLPITTNCNPIILKNGVFAIPSIASFRDDDNVKHFYALKLTVDINGNSGHNIVGEDVFIMVQLFDSKPIAFDGEYNWTFYYASNSFEYFEPITREELLGYCSQGNSLARFCGALIKIDGWEIKDDYPWLK